MSSSKNYEGYVTVKKIGRGGFGEITLRRSPAGNDEIAVKKIAIKSNDPRMEQMAKKEIQIMQQLNQDTIKARYFVNYRGHYVKTDPNSTTKYYYIVMDYYVHGSLQGHLQKVRKLDTDEAIHVLEDIQNGLKIMHRAKIMHRDLSASNIFIYRMKEGKISAVKIADFGLSKEMPTVGGAPQTCVGTKGYRAPEVLRNDYDEKADVYSLGSLLYKMLTGQEPRVFEDKPNADQQEALFNNLNIDKDVADLLKQMLTYDKKARISLKDIESHKCLRKFYKNRQESSSCQNLPPSLPTRRLGENNSHHQIQPHPPYQMQQQRPNVPTLDTYKKSNKDSGLGIGGSGEPRTHSLSRCRHEKVDRENRCTHCRIEVRSGKSGGQLVETKPPVPLVQSPATNNNDRHYQDLNQLRNGGSANFNADFGGHRRRTDSRSSKNRDTSDKENIGKIPARLQQTPARHQPRPPEQRPLESPPDDPDLPPWPLYGIKKFNFNYTRINEYGRFLVREPLKDRPTILFERRAEKSVTETRVKTVFELWISNGMTIRQILKVYSPADRNARIGEKKSPRLEKGKCIEECRSIDELKLKPKWCIDGYIELSCFVSMLMRNRVVGEATLDKCGFKLELRMDGRVILYDENAKNTNARAVQESKKAGWEDHGEVPLTSDDRDLLSHYAEKLRRNRKEDEKKGIKIVCSMKYYG